MDRLNEAIYHTIHGFRDGRRRGAVALAPKLNVPAGTLSNKANPDQSSQLGLLESVPLQLIAKDFQILYAYSGELGHLPPVPFGDFEDTSDADLVQVITRLYADIGKASEALNDAIKDRRITRKEYERVRKFLLQGQQAGHELLCRMEALCSQEDLRAKD